MEPVPIKEKRSGMISGIHAELRFIDPDGISSVTIHQGAASHSDSEGSNQNEVATGQVETARDFLWSDGYGERSSRNSTISIGSFDGAYGNLDKTGDNKSCCSDKSGQKKDTKNISRELGILPTGAAIVETAAEQIKTSQTTELPIYDKSGKVIACWNIISKETGKVLEFVKAGSSLGGFMLGGASIGYDIYNLSNEGLDYIGRFSYHITRTVAATAVDICGTSGLGAMAEAIFIFGENAYDGWMKNIQLQINQGCNDFQSALKKG